MIFYFAAAFSPLSYVLSNFSFFFFWQLHIIDVFKELPELLVPSLCSLVFFALCIWQSSNTSEGNLKISEQKKKKQTNKQTMVGGKNGRKVQIKLSRMKIRIAVRSRFRCCCCCCCSLLVNYHQKKKEAKFQITSDCCNCLKILNLWQFFLTFFCSIMTEREKKKKWKTFKFPLIATFWKFWTNEKEEQKIFNWLLFFMYKD